MHRKVMDIYSCFVLHNLCEAQKDTLPLENICAAISNDTEFEPPTQNLNSRMGANEAEGKAVRRVLTKYFNP